MIWRRLRFLFHRRRFDRDLEEEMRFHLAMRAEEERENGTAPEEAHYAARRAFGSETLLREQSREAWGWRVLDELAQDLRYAARMLHKSPGFAAAAVGLLALGIGANTAIFSVANAVFLRPLPYRNPDRLVWAAEHYPIFNRTMVFTPEYAAWKHGNTVFEKLAALQATTGVNLTAANRSAERVQATAVTHDFFEMLGAQPQIGRVFSPNEGRPDVAILSDALWRNYFQADPKILGTRIVLDGTPSTVVGVMPPGFVHPGAADTGVWLPYAVTAANSVPATGMNIVSVIGRLKPGITPARARADLDVIARRMDSQHVGPWARYHAAATVRVAPLQEQLTGGSRTAILVLMGAVAFILLIVCANVTNLFLARSVAREREFAIRSAIGASRFRMVRLLLVEGLVLGTLGGLLGLALLRWGVPALQFLMPAALPGRIPVDSTVLAFAVICSAATSLLFGTIPALAASKARPQPAGRGGARVRGALSAVQLALSLVLLTGAGLLTRTFLILLSVNPGFDPHNVLMANIALAPLEVYDPPRQAEFFRRAVETIRALPGVEYAAATSETPLVPFNGVAMGLHAEGEPEEPTTVCTTSPSADYFSALHIRLLKGRLFDARDREGAQRTVLLNRSLARLLFKDRNPIGRRIVTGDGPDSWATVVGIIADIRHRALDDKVWPELFRPYEQAPSPSMTLVVRSSAPPAVLAPAIRKAIQAIDRNQPVFGVESLEERLSNSLAERRQRALLLGIFASVALLIAAVGVYAVMAYSVTRRKHEIGVRIALGAQRRDVLNMVMREGLRVALAGIAIGLAGALALTRALSSFLYGVSAADLATYAAVCLMLIAATCLASYLPARRATKVDPMEALRYE
jgi:putative ABC transport system permease protein